MTQFLEGLKEGSRVINVDGKDMPVAIWNLIISKRDLTLWTKIKMKPNRHWKVNTVKKYFGIKGSGEVLMNNFMELYNMIMEEK